MSIPDSIDEQLARLLGQDAQQTSETLANKLKLSSATVRRRLRKLLRNDLLHIVGVVDPSKFGFPLVVVIAIDVLHDKIQTAMEELTKMPGIRWVSTTTGRFDIIALARFRSTASFSDFMKKEMGQLDGLRSSETFVCLDVMKGHHIVFSDLGPHR